jgi:hypothetical protein
VVKSVSDPPAPVQRILNGYVPPVVVVIFWDPDNDFGPAQPETPFEATQDDASELDHDITVVSPTSSVLGEALRFTRGSGGGASTRTVTESVSDPPEPLQRIRKV